MGVSQAGRFKGYQPDGYNGQERKILYIGKATDGNFDEEDAARSAFENKKSAFWSFATSVSRLAKSDGDGRENLAWSNSFKQGVTKGNPSGNFAKEQIPDAIETLRQEVVELKPDLIVLVTVEYYEDIPKAAFRIASGKSEEAGDGKLHTKLLDGQKYSIWWREPFDGVPAVVWMNHPQGKLREYTEAALDVISTVTGWR